jgi:peptidylprolyl isomerase
LGKGANLGRAAVITAALSIVGTQAIAGELRQIPAPAAPADWRPLNPDNTLLIDTTAGRIVVEMRPDLAPKAVERIKLLSREHVYDGLLFHRVIDHFVDQTGNPNNRDGGVSAHPDLEPEFDARIAPAAVAPVAHPAGGVLGFIGATPVEASARLGGDGKARTWGLYCAGVAGMGRQAGENTANSEIFFMRDPARRLDHSYTVWGRAVVGLDVIRAIKIGFPPKAPDRMLRVQVMADLPAAERPQIEVLSERGPAFAALLARLQQTKGADFSPCDIDLPTRVH